MRQAKIVEIGASALDGAPIKKALQQALKDSLNEVVHQPIFDGVVEAYLREYVKGMSHAYLFVKNSTLFISCNFGDDDEGYVDLEISTGPSCFEIEDNDGEPIPNDEVCDFLIKALQSAKRGLRVKSLSERA